LPGLARALARLRALREPPGSPERLRALREPLRALREPLREPKLPPPLPLGRHYRPRLPRPTLHPEGSANW
jgi:hypothetical protein